MNIPKKIHFAGFNYTIEFVEKLDGAESWGRTMLGDGKIFLEKGMTTEKQEQILIHELMHIAYRHTTNELEGKQEETIVNAWSMNIYGILKDNGLLK